MRTQITDSCYRSQISVIPANWDKPTAPISKKWSIYYRYYDQQFRQDKARWGKLIVLKGMNDCSSLHERQAITKALIEQEMDLLDKQQWNPIRNCFMVGSSGLSHSMTFAEAMEWSFKRITGVPGTLNDMKSAKNYMISSAASLFDQQAFVTYSNLPIGLVKRKHLKEIIDNCYLLNKNYTDKRYNVYRKYLVRFYRELIDADIVESNPAIEIRTKQVVRQLKQVLTDKEAETITNHLYKNHYHFWRFVMVFFYSDARETELMQLRKGENVDIDKQEFVVTILKGKAKRDERKQISNEVVDLWHEILSEAKDGQYLFSAGLKPGSKAIRAEQVGRRWFKYVKRDLRINKTLGSLNHLHITKVSKAIGIKAASASRSHTSTVITMTRYDVDHKQRLLEEVKNAGVKFGN